MNFIRSLAIAVVGTLCMLYTNAFFSYGFWDPHMSDAIRRSA